MARGSSIRVRREAAPPLSDLSIPRQELLWAANRDLCVAAKGQQIPVSRDDDVSPAFHRALEHAIVLGVRGDHRQPGSAGPWPLRSEEHTSELQSQSNLVCRL